jgi:hypothetical protein
MKASLIAVMALLLMIGYYLAFRVPIPERRPNVYVSAPDPRVKALEDRVTTLERWAQRQGMKY